MNHSAVSLVLFTCELFNNIKTDKKVARQENNRKLSFRQPHETNKQYTLMVESHEKSMSINYLSLSVECKKLIY